MFVQLQTVDGQLFRSDDIGIAESGMSLPEFDQAVAGVEEIFRSWRDANYVSIDVGGRTKFFNPVNIVWAEIVH
jgi:hypothetical protein